MLIKRMLLLFFRDRANVFFSMLAVLIIIGLYVLFLGDLMEESLRAAIGMDSDKIGVVMGSITLSGMVAVTSITSCMGALGISIADRENAAKDFYTSPAPRGKIVFSYIIGSGIVGLVMTAFALVLCVAYITAVGGTLPGPAGVLRLLLTSVLSVLCGNAMVFCFTSFMKSSNAFSALSTVIGTLIGFLMGIYIPIGSLPEAVQWVIKCFPMSHAAGMFKQITADGELALLFENAPPEVLQEFRGMYGIVFHYGGFESGFWFSAAVLAGATAVFYMLSLAARRVK